MANIAEFQKNIQPLLNPKYLEDIVWRAFKVYEKEALDFNRGRLSKGEDTTGGVLHGNGPYTGTYKPYTYKKSLEDPRPIKPKYIGERYNMEWSGNLFKEMELLFDSNSAIFHSGSESLEELLKVGFENILGLHVEDQIKYISKYIFPHFLIEVRKVMLL